MSDLNTSKIVVETAEDLEYLKGLLQHHLHSKVDQSLVEQLKIILEKNVIIDHVAEEEQLSFKQQEDQRIRNEIDQLKKEIDRKETEILRKINQTADEILSMCQQDCSSLSSTSCATQLNDEFSKTVIQFAADKSKGNKESVDKETILQLNDLMSLC